MKTGYGVGLLDEVEKMFELHLGQGAIYVEGMVIEIGNKIQI